MELFFAKILNGVKLLTIFTRKALSQMLEWVENRFLLMLFHTELTFFPTYKLSRKNTQPENMCDIIFEKAKGHGRKVNRASVYAEAAVRRVL